VRDIILVGGGGHCRSAIEVIEAGSEWRVVGIVGRNHERNNRVFGYSVLGTDEDLPRLIPVCKNYLVTIGHLGDGKRRAVLFEYLEGLGACLAVVVAPTAYVSTRSEIGDGTMVMHGAFVNANVRIGENCIVNSRAVIEHDCRVGSNCHLSTGSVLNGGCVLGDDVFLGSNSTVLQSVTIPCGTVIGAGAVVTKSIREAGTYVGIPARLMSKA
jgi:sugar O-acyltransferase (sialic acid O-acetyltransferase NeuD family)